MKKFLALVLSLCMVFSLAAVASAAEIDADGGSGSTPVYLSSTADGSIGGDPAPTTMSVTIPTGLPMAMSQSGDVTTAGEKAADGYFLPDEKLREVRAVHGNQREVCR